MSFTDKSRFLLRRSDGRVRVFRRRRELFSDNCVIQRPLRGRKCNGVGRDHGAWTD